MTEDNEDTDTLVSVPSYQDWLNDQNAKLDADGFDPVTVRRAWHIAGETPLKFFTAAAYRAAYAGTRGYLRRQGRRAVPAAEGGHRQYLRPEQMELPDIQAFLIANFDRRLADVRAEREFVKEWCAAHEGYTPADVYGLAGLKMPPMPRGRSHAA
jgi:hypothetical protein